MNQKAGSMIYEIASLTLAMTKKKHQRKAPLPPCHCERLLPPCHCEESCKDYEIATPAKKHGGLAMTKEKRHHEGLFPPVIASDRRERSNLRKGIMPKQYYVYLMTNKRNTVLYTGVTNFLKKRIYEHKEKLSPGFTKKYNVTKLVYYEIFNNIYNALSREKQIKAGSRKKKIMLVNSLNPGWKDLYYEL